MLSVLKHHCMRPSKHNTWSLREAGGLAALAPSWMPTGAVFSADTSPDTSEQEGDWKNKRSYSVASFIYKKQKNKACRNADIF